MPKISIVMPLYNAQKYLEEALRSVLNQTFTDYELICVNDGSNDNTQNILHYYQKKDARIRILENSTRSGAAYSRNKGIVEARGKYVIFLDGDDIFEEEMLSVSYETAEKNNTDVLMFSHKHVLSDQIYNKVQIVHGNNYVKKYCKKPFSVEKANPCEILLWSTSPCNKLFNKKFIMDNKIIFQNLSCANDVYFVKLALMLSERSMVLNDDRVMVYARDHDEPSRISSRRDPMCCYRAYKYLLERLINEGKMEVLYRHYFYSALFSFKSVLEKTKEQEETRCFYEFLQNEGISALRESSKKYQIENDEYLSYFFSQFEKQNYETRWFEDESILKLFIRESPNKFSALFLNANVIVWGAGKNGRTILQKCQEMNLKVKYVVDRDERKQGKYIEKYCIMKPESVICDLDTVLISVYGIVEEVKDIMNQYGSKARVVDINDYLEIC